MLKLFSVEDKVVVVTGGMGQLGCQFTKTLIDQGAKVAVFDVRVDDSQVAKRFGESLTARRTSCSCPSTLQKSIRSKRALIRLRGDLGYPMD